LFSFSFFCADAELRLLKGHSPSPHLIPKCPRKNSRDEAESSSHSQGKDETMKHFTILNRQGLLTRSYGKAVPISSKGAAALDGRQREAESYQKIAAR
jgi:hypothetical protein